MACVLTSPAAQRCCLLPVEGGVGRALARDRRRSARLTASLAVNLTLNAGWSWLFFTRRNPKPVWPAPFCST
ncbi:hypothetical protein [Streptomyces collinus]|uniref:hypothetical protein n=1 Tax=Streptomyces collinus TaxID=42684 RepID=UPI0029428F54|nr:hypothetical protein [Streptomyces collinus]